MLVAEDYASDRRVLAHVTAEIPDIEIAIWPDCGAVAHADLLVTWRIPSGMATLPADLKAIFCYGAGVEHILGDPRVPAGLPVMRLTDGGQAEAMLDYALAAILTHRLRLDDYARLQARREWAPTALPSAGVAGARVAVLGLGQIGSVIAEGLARAGFSVHGWTRREKVVTGVAVHVGSSGLLQALSGANAVVNVLPADPALGNILDYAALDQPGHGAVLVNIGRASHLDLAALRHALDHNLGGAWLDVLPVEPFASDSWLWTHPAVRLTPHVAGIPDPDKAAISLVAALRALQRGTPLPGLVRPR